MDPRGEATFSVSDDVCCNNVIVGLESVAVAQDIVNVGGVETGS